MYVVYTKQKFVIRTYFSHIVIFWQIRWAACLIFALLASLVFICPLLMATVLESDVQNKHLANLSSFCVAYYKWTCLLGCQINFVHFTVSSLQLCNVKMAVNVSVTCFTLAQSPAALMLVHRIFLLRLIISFAEWFFLRRKEHNRPANRLLASKKLLL